MTEDGRQKELRDLAFLLGRPDAEGPAVLGEMAASRPWLAEAVTEIRALPLEEWQGEHTRLFVTGYPHTPCPPFASAWLDGRMQGVWG